ncbi:MAG: hypothetical protein ABJ239_00600 [Erythrobacter sp.]
MDVVHAPLVKVERLVAEKLLFDDGKMRLARDRFTFTSPSGAQFRYVLGQRIALHVPDGLEDEARLFLWGTVFGAVAWLNDLLPLHASAVEAGGRIIAFTADSGGGKSTLAAALAERDFRHVCDDTLVLAPSDAGFVGLPDGKPLKLWDEALSLVSVSNLGRISTVPGKNYAEVGNVCADPAPISDLVFMEEGEDVSLTPIIGSEKLQCFPQAMYRNFLHTARDDADYHAQLMVMAATNLRFWRLKRPRNLEVFQQTTDAIANLLRA